MARFFCFGNLHSECKLPNKIQKKKEMEVQNFMPTLNLENRTQTTKKLWDMERIKHLFLML